METSLEGTVALITGAGRGIGRSIALTLAKHGAKIVLSARSQQELQTVQAEITKLGQEAIYEVADVSLETHVKKLVEKTVQHFGRLDIVVNNAGLGIYGPLLETSVETWDKIMAVNARGPFLVCREAIPHLKKQKRSFIINISSVVGVKGYENQTAYTASKHALMGLSKALAKEVQQDGIRVHALCPGAVSTQMVALARPDLNPSVLMQPDEIADIVLFLVTRQGNAVMDEVVVRREASTPWG
jgi:3-oxoacyl-[acyl-carrier protein] reductase